LKSAKVDISFRIPVAFLSFEVTTFGTNQKSVRLANDEWY